MATISMTSGGYIVNGVKLTTTQYSAWKKAGSPNNVSGWLSGSSTTSTSSTSTSSSSASSTVNSSPADIQRAQDLANQSSQSGITYYNWQGAYFQKDAQGNIKAVSDASVLNSLRLGVVPTTSGSPYTTPSTSTQPPSPTGTQPTTGTGSTTGSTTGSQGGNVNVDALAKDINFQNLPKDQQDIVRQVYTLIASNDLANADRLKAAFEAASKISDPYFKQQIKMAKDALERGFVNIKDEQVYKEKQLRNRLTDLEQDIEARSEFLTLEEQSQLRGIEREYQQTLKTTRQNLAASGFSSSSRREETETLIEETTGDLRESTKRRFGAQISEAAQQLTRGRRDINDEIERLSEVTKARSLDLLREAEATLGTKNLPSLNTNLKPLGGVVGELPQRQTEDIISASQNLLF